MLPKNTPAWITTGGCILAVIAGCINAVGFMGIHHQAISHMSGNVTTFGLNLAGSNRTLVWHTGSVIVSFFFGSVLSAFILRQSNLLAGRRYGAVLAIESGLLFAAAHCLRDNLYLGDYLLAMACGLQNAMATSYSGAVIRTTHVSGMITDIGIAVGHYLRRKAVDWQRIRLYGVIIVSFLTGSYFGAESFIERGYDTLFFPATFAGGAGVAYTIFRQMERKQNRRTQRVLSHSLRGAALGPQLQTVQNSAQLASRIQSP